MSFIKCDTCPAVIDSDADPDCFVPHPGYSARRPAPDLIRCERCREREQEKIEALP